MNWRLHVLRGQPAGKSPREETAEEKRTRLTKRLEFCNILRKNGESAIAKSRLQEDWISAQALALKSDEAEDRGIAVVFCCRLGELCKAEGNCIIYHTIRQAASVRKNESRKNTGLPCRNI